MSVHLKRNLPIGSDVINELRRAAWKGLQGGDWNAVLAHSLGWICATDGDRLIGFVNVAWDGGAHAFLLDTTVHPDYQRQGLGRALVQEAVQHALEHGVEWLHVDYEDQLEPFYRSCGFRPTAAGLLHLTEDQAGQEDA